MKIGFYFSVIFIVVLASFLGRGLISGFVSPRLMETDINSAESVLERIKEEITAPPPLRLPREKSGTATSVLSSSAVFDLTNKERVNTGLVALGRNSKLDEVASLRLNDMFKYQYFAHESPSGLAAGEAASSTGYDYIALGENLALGNFRDNADLVAAWMASPGHRANILNERYVEIGVAVKKGIFEGKENWIAVQIFGKPSSDCPKLGIDLRDQIELTEANLKNLETSMAFLRTEIDDTRPKNSSFYVQKVSEYNALVEQYNRILDILKSMVRDYNIQVGTYNQCISV
ncbi:MAG: CAP domain-containing protein [Patescibacteria group bacterium]